ncbi:SAM-dependent methyltransferase [Hydrogenovibrio sp. SC-1]|uniref:class I SAM-dependent DNA methyltransferase n=1 Tax=Hydrogenovibrio sp. SC-1 TaxID=2065820 RepID=UPI000C7DD15B|nr:class I SAM-dependent methyltransferase [Hydrogenovibrio sp. SC-1]PLA73582.1 SAM-dependent methyltransferase [Hydrogenovibrio sp. SC-1]
MSESWDDYADGWDSNEAVISYCDKAYESLLKIVDLEGLKVLDFGCGTGLLTEKISKHASSVVAMDSSEKMISILTDKRLNHVHTINAELSQELIELNDVLKNDLDLIVASSVLAFVPDYQETLKLLKQLLKKDGLLVQWDWLKESEEPGIGFSKELIESTLAQAGFSKCSISIPFSMESENGSMRVVMGVAVNA